MKHKEFWISPAFYTSDNRQQTDDMILLEPLGEPFDSNYIHVIEHSAYADAIKMLEEMAGALEGLQLLAPENHEMPWYSEVIFNSKDALENYRKWKEGMK